MAMKAAVGPVGHRATCPCFTGLKCSVAVTASATGSSSGIVFVTSPPLPLRAENPPCHMTLSGKQFRQTLVENFAKEFPRRLAHHRRVGRLGRLRPPGVIEILGRGARQKIVSAKRSGPTLEHSKGLAVVDMDAHDSMESGRAKKRASAVDDA